MSKFRSRMGAAVRKSSAVFTFANSRPPSRSSSEIDATSVKSSSKLDVSTNNLSTSPDHNRSIVSPIAESPVVVLPSPEVTTNPPPKAPEAPAAPQVEELASQQPVEAAPQPDAPSVVAETKPVTVGMLPDEIETRSVSGKDDHIPQQSVVEEPQRTNEPEEQEAVPEHLPNPHSPPPGAFTDPLFELPPAAVAQAPSYEVPTEPVTPVEEPYVSAPPVEPVTVAPILIPSEPQPEPSDAIHPATLHDSPRSVSYLNLPEPEVKPTTPSEAEFRRSVEERPLGNHKNYPEQEATHEVPEEEPAQLINIMPIIPPVGAHESLGNGHSHVKMPEPEEDDQHLLRQPVSILPVAEPAQYPEPSRYEHPPFWNSISAKPSQVSMRQPQDQYIHPQQPSDGRTLYDDPFADPVVPVAPGIVMPSAQVPHVVQSEDHAGKSLNHAVSTRSLVPSAQPTHERTPLLPKRISPQPSTYTYTNGVAQADSPVVAPSAPMSKLQQLGWFEYSLPDGTCYYVHATYRIVTDLDLHDDRRLQAVTDYLELGADFQGRKFERRKEVEIWLRNISTNPNDTLLTRSWVDHSKKRVSIFPPHVEDEQNGTSGSGIGGEDQLDAGYRYWSFIESHPAHMALPLTATREAMEALTWSYTDQLLPSDHGDSTPFSMNECQELMNLLRSFEGTQDATSPSPVKTRVIARVHVRVAQWHQAHFRPNKPLPTDVAPNYQAKKQASFRRKLTDAMITCLCFGIPYLLFQRTQRRIDEEARLLRLPSSGPVLVVGSCTCLVAAIVLSASVTFISLPGMDSIARIAAITSILFSTSSMATSIMALFRYKAETDRAMAITRQIIGEGMLIEYRRSVVLSLPVVFLIYALIGFVTGIVLYSFRGVEVHNPLDVVKPFDQYTRWITVGVLGTLAGLLSTVVISVGRH